MIKEIIYNMEFITFLDKNEIEIIKLIEKAGYSAEENTPLCLLGKEYVGFIKKKQKRLVICTNNVKKREGYKGIKPNRADSLDKTSIHIKKALRHEAVHIAQECNNGNLLNLKKTFKLNPAKLIALKGSTKISGEEAKEKEAYILEDRPKLIINELKKYCL